MEIKSPKEDINMTDYPNGFDRKKLKKMLAITDSNKFNYENKIGEFEYIDIKDLVNNIRNNTISEIDAKKDLNTLNEIKNAEIIKYKRRTSKQKEILNLLDTVLTDKTLKSKMEKKRKRNMKKVKEKEKEKENKK